MASKKPQNEKCPCGSNRRFKFCCKNNVYQQQNPDNPESLRYVTIYLREEFPDCNIIDISHNLENNNYANYQYANMGAIMIAEKNTKNSTLFNKFNSSNRDVIVMWNGTHICFTRENWDKAKVAVDNLISGKANMKCYSCNIRTKKASGCSSCDKNLCLDCARKVVTDANSIFTQSGFSTDCPFCNDPKTIEFVRFKKS
jgi:hypothetical protein